MKHSLVNIIKYIIFSVIVFMLFKLVPFQKTTNIEIVCMVSLILVGFYSIDIMTPINSIEKMDDLPKANGDYDIDLNPELKVGNTSDVKNIVNAIGSKQNTDNINDKITKLENKVEELSKKKYGSDPQQEAVQRINDLLKDKKPKFTEDNLDKIKYMENQFKTKEQKLKKVIEEIDNDENKLSDSDDQIEDKDVTMKLIKLYLRMLEDKRVLSKNEIKNIKIKIQSNIFSPKEIVEKLELLVTKSVDGGYDDWGSENINKDSLLPSQKKPLGSNDQTVTNKWDHDYTYLDTEKWRVPMPKPPVCVNNSEKCAICPSTTTGYPTDLKEWNNSRYVTTSNKQSSMLHDQ
jgi:hypothetical protein